MRKIAIVAGNADRQIYKNLKNMGLTIIKTRKCGKVYDSIGYHPDIQLCLLDKTSLVVAPGQYDYFRERLSPYGLEVIKGETELGEKYPKNISYNVGIIDNYAFHTSKYTDPILKRELEKRSIELIDIKQGYSKCSMAVIDKDKLITADRIIDKEARRLGLDSLLISPGHISLEGQNYGFIGGSTGFKDGQLLVAGHLKDHPDMGRVEKFLAQSNYKLNYLSDKRVEDLGTIFII